jgi:hypothetical protein
MIDRMSDLWNDRAWSYYTNPPRDIPKVCPACGGSIPVTNGKEQAHTCSFDLREVDAQTVAHHE